MCHSEDKSLKLRFCGVTFGHNSRIKNREQLVQSFEASANIPIVIS
jgi:hypothetical protein